MSEQRIGLQHQASIIHKLTLEETERFDVGHVGGSLSIYEALATLYFRLMKIDPHNPGQPERDRPVLSKGHGGPALYAALALKGYSPMELLDTLNRPGTMLPSHCDVRRTISVDTTTGSLKQDFSAVVEMAFAVQMGHLPSTIYTIIDGGESDEGQIWEAAMFAGGRRLDHLIAFTDYNKMQIDGYTQEINPLESLEDKWRAFGWHVQSIDGHSTDEIVGAVEQAKRVQGRPSMILLNMIEGKGASFSEGELTFHNMKLTGEMWGAAVAELEKEGA